MKQSLKVLVAVSALTATIGLPAWSAMQAPTNGGHAPVATLFEVSPQAMPLVLVSGDDDDDDDDRGWRFIWQRGHDDDDCDDDDDDDEGDDDGCRGRGNNAAPAGSVAPPQNGLFESGAAPQIQGN